MNSTIEIVRKAVAISRRARSYEVFKILEECVEKAEKAGCRELAINWVAEAYDGEDEWAAKPVVLTIDRQTCDTMFVTVYNMHVLDMNAINGWITDEYFELGRYKHPYERARVIGSIYF
jgi:hypothetical protein|nr:MAG TPA: hypothetical protein [Caudoviricetes sp.]